MDNSNKINQKKQIPSHPKKNVKNTLSEHEQQILEKNPSRREIMDSFQIRNHQPDRSTGAFCICVASVEKNQIVNGRQRLSIDLGIKGIIHRWMDQEEDKNNPSKKPIVELLKELYENSKSRNSKKKIQIIEALGQKRLNPESGKIDRDDLEYFIPQLLTYLVYQIDLQDRELIDLVLGACQTHYVFSHFCYFYLESLSEIAGQELREVKAFIKDEFLPRMIALYKKSKLCGFQLAKCSQLPIYEIQPSDIQIDAIKKYGTIDQDQILIDVVKGIKIQNYVEDGYLSTPSFWKDLIDIGESLSQCYPKRIGLIKCLKDINAKLPAAVYIPFLKDDLRYYTVLNIDCQYAKVFSTKTRSPYSIYIQVFREEEQFSNQKLDIKEKISKPVLVSGTLNSLNLPRVLNPYNSQIWDNKLKQEKKERQYHILKALKSGSEIVREKKKKERRFSEDYLSNKQNKEFAKENLKILRDQYSTERNFIYPINEQNQSDMPLTQMPSTRSIKGERTYIDSYFDTPFETISNNIKKNSIYKNFKSLRVINLLIKTGDDLKQEQFAMQLIKQFDVIFQKQKTGLHLRPYEVVSLGPDCGILEMVTDASPLAKIFKTMSIEGVPSLKQFFKMYFKGAYKDAQKNFCKSLAAYALVTYFLQVKDRHNQNILLDKSGHIIHIDFGFFISNAPGKGVEIEKNVPFKLTSAYVEVLGGQHSLLFLEFRKLFYLGFKAAIKHRHEIITLVKMMYSSHGESMRCFLKREKCIEELEERLKQSNNIQIRCNNLINDSLDNWRAKWYDRFQFWLQGIAY